MEDFALAVLADRVFGVDADPSVAQTLGRERRMTA